MFSDKENVNILTSILCQWPIGGYVVCPGSRNAPIVHNLNAIAPAAVYEMIDERSAAFMALGISEASGKPAVVCVTSGSALANVMPAVVEAYYRGLPLIVVSADRPPQWIDQHDGQTIRQEGLFGRYANSYTLPEITSLGDVYECRWLCNRVANDAIGKAMRDKRPVHVNVPISEPLYHFSVSELPQERIVERHKPTFYDVEEISLGLGETLAHALRPLAVVGQLPCGGTDGWIGKLSSQMPVLMEPLGGNQAYPIDEVLSVPAFAERDDLLPDVVVYMGGEVISKRLKQFLRRAHGAKVFRIDPWGEVLQDTFMNLSAEFVGEVSHVLCNVLLPSFGKAFAAEAYRAKWLHYAELARKAYAGFVPVYSSFLAVGRFVARREEDCCVIYANSMPVRLASIHERRHVGCNRGVNGIEGSLSVAAGISLWCVGKRTYCVMGDLSFLYDHNCLQNEQLTGRLRILVLNNGGGAIFGRFEGLRESDARHLVLGRHHCSVEGVCQSFGVYYLSAANEDELERNLVLFFSLEVSRPVVLEVFTDMEKDCQVLADYQAFVSSTLGKASAG